MTLTLWQVLLGIAAGSITGALLRQATTVLLPSAAKSMSLRFTVSALGGALLGALLGWVTTRTLADSAWQPIAMIAVVAALGTFAATAVVDTPLLSSETTRRFRHAAVHIGITLLSAALGIAFALWWRTR